MTIKAAEKLAAMGFEFQMDHRWTVNAAFTAL